MGWTISKNVLARCSVSCRVSWLKTRLPKFGIRSSRVPVFQANGCRRGALGISSERPSSRGKATALWTVVYREIRDSGNGAEDNLKSLLLGTSTR